MSRIRKYEESHSDYNERNLSKRESLDEKSYNFSKDLDDIIKKR